ncbi:hypothetical protein AB0H58_31400 [Nocardia neocaledoniensis]|uniref:hypothetical protein n=1 Tax=Nocardia neocaledoniensis TaxID=236511 RepID=UPI0033C24F4F
MSRSLEQDGWKPWTGSDVELDDLGDEVEVYDLGCTGMTRAAAAQDRQLTWIRKAGGTH